MRLTAARDKANKVIRSLQPGVSQQVCGLLFERMTDGKVHVAGTGDAPMQLTGAAATMLLVGLYVGREYKE